MVGFDSCGAWGLSGFPEECRKPVCCALDACCASRFSATL